MRWRITSLLLNLAHAIDHLMLLVFATAVSAIAHDFGIGRWEDLMPYTTGPSSCSALDRFLRDGSAICGAGAR